ncbi:hypothetical protein [Rhodococcus sp. USK10]|uniref:hypothetical protein n=1 Tax=Rhodococcus sp. USK10 TaxID=2789739 RepID=UPI0035B51B25
MIVDDWHRITDPTTLCAIDFQLTNSCHHRQVVVTSRSRSEVPHIRLRVRDELVEIDATALRFDDEEARSFLVGIRRIARLRSFTDGWVAAMQLAHCRCAAGTTPPS